MVAADARGVVGDCDVDGAEGVGAFGDDVACEDEVVFFGVVLGFGEEGEDWMWVRGLIQF